MIVFEGKVRTPTGRAERYVRVSVTEANGVVVERSVLDAEGGSGWVQIRYNEVEDVQLSDEAKHTALKAYAALLAKQPA